MKLPFLADLPAEHVIAFGKDGTISVGQLLADIHELAQQLPQRRYMLNDCADRYHFIVGLGAALLREQVSLFPGNRVAHVWRQLQEDYPDSYCLTDQDDAPTVLEVMRYDARGTEPGAGLGVPSFPESQLAAIAFTSGSTGRSKPFARYWGAFVREALTGGASLGLSPETGGAIVATVPPQHMYGFVASVMVPLQFGYAVSRERPFYPEDIRAAVESSPAEPILVITPVQLRACVMEKPVLPAIRFVLSSAAPLPRSIAEEAEAAFRTRVYEYYGSTETGAIACRRQQDSEVWRTFEGVRVRPHADGYLVEADYFEPPVVLNDVVEIVNPREFRLLGRATDLVKIGGKRSSLFYLNQILQAIPGVVDGVFVMEPGVQAHEPRLSAFVVAPDLTRENILAALRERLDDVFLPRRLRLVPALPRNGAGKIPREQLATLIERADGNGAVADSSAHG